MLIPILFAIPAHNCDLVIAQQLSPAPEELNVHLNSSMMSVQNQTMREVDQDQIFMDGSNQSLLIPDPIRGNLSQPNYVSPGVNGTNGETGPVGPQGEVGPQGPPGNNSAILKDNLYINSGLRQSPSDDSPTTTSAKCNGNDIPISGGYSIVSEDEDENNGEINEIESIPNLQNNSWTVNVIGDNIEVTPYVVCLTVQK